MLKKAINLNINTSESVANSPVELLQGDTPLITVNVTTDGSTPMDLTGLSALLTMAKDDVGVAVIGTISAPATGVITFEPTGDDTSVPGNWRTDISLTDGTDRQTLYVGRFRVESRPGATSLDEADQTALYVVDSLTEQTFAGILGSATDNASLATALASASGTSAFAGISGAVADNAALVAAFDTKSDSGHTHDDRYYTETETDTILAGKSDTSHGHTGVYEPIIAKTYANGLLWVNATADGIGHTSAVSYDPIKVGLRADRVFTNQYKSQTDDYILFFEKPGSYSNTTIGAANCQLLTLSARTNADGQITFPGGNVGFGMTPGPTTARVTIKGWSGQTAPNFEIKNSSDSTLFKIDNAGFIVNGQTPHGEMYEDNESGSTITVTTAGTYYLWSTSTGGEVSGSGYVTHDSANDRLVIGSSGVGVYRIAFNVSFSGSISAEVKGVIHKNDTPQSNIKVTRKLGTGGDIGTASAEGFLSLSNGDYIDLRFTSDGNGDTIVVEQVNVSLLKVGD